MQSVSSRIWNRVAVTISYHDNHYTTGTSVTYEQLFSKVRLQRYFSKYLAAFLCSSHLAFSPIVRDQMVQLYCSTDTVTVKKKIRFISYERSDFYIIDNLSIADHSFPKCILTSFGLGMGLGLFGFMAHQPLWVIKENSILNTWTVLFQTISLSISTPLNCQKHLYFKLFSFVKQF